MKLKREFVFVHRNTIDRVTESDLLYADQMERFGVTECYHTFTIVCRDTSELGEAMHFSHRNETEGSTLNFLLALQRAIVDFIG